MPLLGLVPLLLSGAVPSQEEAKSLRWSLVTARAVRQRNPQSLDCAPDEICLDAMFDGRFDDARTLAGLPVPRRFGAKVVQHMELGGKPRVLLLMYQRQNGDRVVFAQMFPDEKGRACGSRSWFEGRLDLSGRSFPLSNSEHVCVAVE